MRHDTPIEPNQITYFPEMPGVKLEPFCIHSYAGPPAVGSTVYLRNIALHNDEEYNYQGRNKWTVKDSYESIMIEGNPEGRRIYRHQRRFQVILVPA